MSDNCTHNRTFIWTARLGTQAIECTNCGRIAIPPSTWQMPDYLFRADNQPF